MIKSLLSEIDRGREGKSWGYSMGLPKLEEMIDGVTRGTYTTIFANSGVGKSSVMLYAYVYRPMMDHLEDGNFRVTLFALEMKAEIILAKLLAMYIFETYGVELSSKELFSRKRNYTLSDKDYEYVQKSIPWLEKVDKILTIYDKDLSAKSMYAILMKELKQEGKFIESETRTIYEPSNPDLIHLVVIDHGCLLIPTDGRTQKEEIDLASKFLKTLRNRCNISPIMIMQSNREQTSSARRQLGFFLPQTSDVKQTNNPVEDSDVVLAVYNPHADNRGTHNGYDINQLGDSFRSIVCLKNRYGETNIEDNCLFYGKLGIFKEAPNPNEIYDYQKLLSTDYVIKPEDEQIKIPKKLNFTL